ncbi:hypothetical protein GO730_31730 [Spirosoma sp. HMF3257]|uniref:Peptidase C39-like domain-containing protein n=1 Tax=Spirosoma telluris TaxID=2183553 RepID=A0A327NQC9_9BACT|nr:hypothetical protein [Spirosoma telluris]RAI77570.1 hypothetical protein HMF3257_31620 [Spirosoma telluris]
MKNLLKPTRLRQAIVVTILLVLTSMMTLWAQTSGGCSYSEGQFLFTTSWGESVYAHYYNGSLFAAYQDGSNFRPQHWLVATGQMSSSTASCFAENDPHTTTPPTNPPTGNCPYIEGQFLFTTSWGESVYAHFYNGTLLAAYQDGSNFKPQHWLVATGQMSTSTASCFAENDPHTTTTTPTTTTTTNPPAGANFAGNLDGAECNGIGGWVMNRNATNQSTKFDVYINGQLAASNVSATNSRQDVSNAFGISGYNAFGFSWTIPAQYKNGSALSISVKYAGTNTDIPGSPKTTAACQGSGTPTTPTTPTTSPTTSPALAGSNFAGNLDGADCNGIGGWVVNKNTPHKSTKFDVYINGWLVAVGVPATDSRQDVANALGISGYNAFGFYLRLPNSYKTGSAMTISVKYYGTQTDIPGSPKTTVACPVNPLGCSNDGSGRLAQTESTTYSRTDGVSMKLGGGGSSAVSSLTSKLIPVRKGDKFSLDAYVYAPIRPKANLTPQITTAVVGGVVAGVAIAQQQAIIPDQAHRSMQTAPAIGVGSTLMIPLVKALLAKRLPNASVDVAFYDQHGRFVHRQQVGITKAARQDWQLLHIQGYAEETGYVVVRLQNRSKTPVWFDDVSFQTVQLPRSSLVNKGLFVPKNTTSTSGFAPQQPINTESLYRNCTQQYDTDPIWLPEVTVYAGNWLPEATVTGTGSGWGWISVPNSGSIIGGSTGSGGTGVSTGVSTGGGGGSSSTATFVPYNAPIDSVATGLSTTGALTKGQEYTSPTGAAYVWDGKSWCAVIAETQVKGQRPANPANGQFYIYTDPQFGYATVYEYISGRWTMPMVVGDDPIKIKNLPKTIEKQIGPNLCVPTVMRFLLQYYCNKGDFDINTINNYYHDTYQKWAVLQGVDLQDMNGLVGHYFNIGSFTTAYDALKVGQPTMVAIPTDDPNTLHEVLVTGYDPSTNQYTYLDPITGGEAVTSSTIIDNSPSKYSVSCK